MKTTPGVLLLAATLLAACGEGSPAAPSPEARGPSRPVPVDVGRDEGAPAVPASAPLVVFLGDSISAGLHLPAADAFPAVLQRELAAAGHPFRLVNAGVSGDTTAGGVSRLDWLLSQHPDVVVVELGGNDGLRGVPLSSIEENLRTIVARVRAAGAVPVLLGMRLPSNYDGYGEDFATLYGRVAEDTGTALVPFLMEEIAGGLEHFLPDGIHPTAEGHRLLAGTVRPVLERVLGSLAE